ncbi:MAG: hypothetical protein IIT78_01010 [Mycoplasmataceae bacterium]|nr:hypothetical protein [Mycoplasmataceae bacterium]
MSATEWLQSTNTADKMQILLAISQGLAIISPLAICVAFFSIVGTLTIGISVLPQTVDTIKNQQTQTFSWLMYVFLVVGCFFLMIYGIGLVEAGGAIEGTYYSAAKDGITQSNGDAYIQTSGSYIRQNMNYTYLALCNWLADKTSGGSTNADVIDTWAQKNGYDNSNGLLLIFALVLSGKTTITNTSGDAVLTGLTAFNPQDFLYTVNAKGDHEAIKNVLVVTASTYRNYQVNYTTPGGLLIIGEGFASLTSAIVLWYKVKNMMMAKKEGISEAEYCTKLLEEIKAKKGAKK